jgi:hypothetical protein
MKNFWLPATLLLAGSNLFGGPIIMDNWYDIRWSAAAPTVLTNGAGFSAASGETIFNPGAGPWTITIGAAGATLFLLDIGAAGDRFEIFNSAVSMGTSSAVAASGGGNCGLHVANCIANLNVSRATIALGAGSYSFDFNLIQNATGTSSGGAIFMVQSPVASVPEPGTMALIGLGVGALVLRRRK